MKHISELNVKKLSLGIITIIISLLALVGFLNWLIAPTNPLERNAVVQTAAQVLAGFVLLAGLVFTWRAHQLNQQNLEQNQQTLQVNQEHQQRSLELAREERVTDRFIRAVEQLAAVNNDGIKRLEVRLGGIYGLERIARESEQDYWSIIEILTAYIRLNAPVTDRNILGLPSSPEEDIQAILTVLGRRHHWYGNGESSPLDLRSTLLQCVDLRGAHLENADLACCDLREAKLTDAHFEGADLDGVDIGGANLRGCRFTGANLSSSNFTPVMYLRNSVSKEDTNGYTNVTGADFSGADLRGADLRRAVGLTLEQLRDASWDEDTEFPDYPADQVRRLQES